MMFSGNNNDKKTKSSTRDFLAKIFSVIAAILLWFYVAHITTTTEELVVSGVPVKLKNFNPSASLDIIDGKQHVIEVTVSGLKNELSKISKDNIEITADMNGIDSAGVYKLDLNITTPAGISVINKSASEVSVTVDKTTSRHFPIEVKTRYTDVEASVYEIGDPILSASSIQITGPQKVVDSIDKILVTLNMDVIRDTIDSKGCTVTPVDAEENAVQSPYIKLNQSTVDVLIPVYKQAEVEVVPVYSDELNYIISYSDFSPKVVNIKGKVEAVDSIDCIFTETIDVEKAKGSLNVNLNLPDGISAYDKNGNAVHSVRINDFYAVTVSVPFSIDLTGNNE